MADYECSEVDHAHRRIDDLEELLASLAARFNAHEVRHATEIEALASELKNALGCKSDTSSLRAEVLEAIADMEEGWRGTKLAALQERLSSAPSGEDKA